MVIEKSSRNQIDLVRDIHEVLYEGHRVPLAFVSHYRQFLGEKENVNAIDGSDLFPNQLSEAKANAMVRDVTREEVKEVMFSIGDCKSPGPDGYTFTFFKKA